MLLKVPYCTVHEDVLLEVVLEAWQPLNEHVNMMLMEIFKMFDTSGDGYLSCDEFAVLVREVRAAGCLRRRSAVRCHPQLRCRIEGKIPAKGSQGGGKRALSSQSA